MRRVLSSILVLVTLGIVPSTAQESVDLAMIGRIKLEGLQRSRAQEMYLNLTDRRSPDGLSVARPRCALGSESVLNTLFRTIAVRSSCDSRN